MPYKIIEEEERSVCLECGQEVYGRSDKKFCSDVCRNSFHNRRTNGRKKVENRVIGILRRNYDILEQFISLGQNSIPLGVLDGSGYVREIVTGHRKTATGHDEYTCFDIRYCQTGRKIFKLERFQLTVQQVPEREPQQRERRPYAYGTRR